MDNQINEQQEGQFNNQQAGQPTEVINEIKPRKNYTLAIVLLVLVIFIMVFAGGVFAYLYFSSKTNNIVADVPMDTSAPVESATPSPSGELSVVFTPPYPVVFSERDNTPNFGGAGKFSLTGVTIGDYEVTESNKMSFWDGFKYTYDVGQKINSVALEFKINVTEGGQLPQSIRMISVDEAGGEDRTPPINRDYLYDGHKPMNDFATTDSTVENAQVVFAVPEGATSFMFTSGGSSEIKFSVAVNNGQISVNQANLGETSTFTKYMTGNIGIDVVEVMINREGGVLAGNFVSDKKVGIIKGTVDSAGNYFMQLTFLEDNQEYGVMTGALTLVDDITGNWRAAGSLEDVPFTLTKAQIRIPAFAQ